MTKLKSTNSIDLYHKNYFLQVVDGFKEYSGFSGDYSSLFERYQKNINLLELSSENNFLEFGCGRGEVCIYHSLRGGNATGIDYSIDAINLAIDKARSIGARAEFIAASFSDAKIKNNYYDRILASEFIEHISAEEGREFVKIAYAALQTGGRLLIFTHPNTLQRKIGYPLIRILNLMKGVYLPNKQADTLDEHYRLYHLNEQNFFSLRKLVVECGFKIIDMGYDVDFDEKNGSFRNFAFKIIKNSFLKHFLLTNLYVVAEK